MNESEIRQNKITKQWVIYAPARRKRPKDFEKPEHEKVPVPLHDKECPFCPGNDHMITSIITEIKEGEDSWKIRVVPNKFPALIPKNNIRRYNKGIYLAMKGYGHHEVVIETPYHNQEIAQMSLKEVELIIEVYHKRYRELIKEDENMMVIIFRNHGLRAGTSLIHPHSQIISTGMVPGYIRWREEMALHYFDEWGHCVYCEVLAYEMKDKRRVVYENDLFVAFVPFAAEVPFEILIMPKMHKANFGDISDNEKSSFALALKNILERLKRKLNDPDYNYTVNTSVRYRAEEPQLHWHLLIRPRLTTQAGFEIGSGININPSIPEEDARFLKHE
ncbi:MAG: Galactose-1-phosphate uridylyltransferase [Candidatus Jettenia ecosi]|uniref:Galactose-1-phosphate uridylyltransferase n=1 Tax=Candidatus Jettenia ecosi TaxID=2494326 RepID=A0A533Q897_9BACT|nr:MAG: Galactose-1-phosphate uridylyltransferase [Candidatus Jettenia ecosi]